MRRLLRLTNRPQWQCYVLVVRLDVHLNLLGSFETLT